MKIKFLPLIFFLSTIGCAKNIENQKKIFSKKWDFSQNKIPSEWTPKATSWKIEDGALINDDKYTRADMLVFNPGDVSDFLIEADIKIEKEYIAPKTTWAGFHLRSELPMYEPPWNNGYLVILYQQGAVTAVCLNSDLKYGAVFKPTAINGFNKLRVKMTGSLMQIFVNGKKLLQFKNEKYKSGGISLVNYGNKAIFDNLKLQARMFSPTNFEKKITKINPSKIALVKPLPKITVKRGKNKSGFFVYKKTGKKFTPDGYNHTIGDNSNYKIPHATFNIGTYNSKRIDNVLSEMKKLGANTIRVWLWGTDTGGNGIWGGPNSDSLNYDYLNNFCDFLRLATKHKIYVIPILDLPPNNKRYKNIIKSFNKKADKNIVGHNADILTKGFIEARKQAARDTVSYIKETDPNLLNTILGWSLANEIIVVSDQLPFSLTNGKVRVANGKVYDMSDFNSRQKCADDSFSFWAKEIAGAIKEIIPDALVTIGMWTSDAHKRPPVNGIKITEINDPRFPPRPSVLANSKSGIDFLDIHVYPWQNKFLINAEAHELDKLNRSGIPVLVGEYGVFTYQAKDAKAGAKKIVELRKKCYDAGYAGALLWVWNYTNGLYNGEIEEVRKALSRARKN